MSLDILFMQYTQQKALKADTNVSNGWSSGVFDLVKTQWNRATITLTSALVNEHQQWNRMASWTSEQVKKLNNYFRPPSTGQ